MKMHEGQDNLIKALDIFLDESTSLRFLEINGVPDDIDTLKTLISLESSCYKIPTNLNSIFNKSVIDSYSRYWTTVVKHCDKKGLEKVSSDEIIKLTFGLHPGCIKDTTIKNLIFENLSKLLSNKRNRTSQMNLEMIKNYLFKYFIWIDEIFGTILNKNIQFISLTETLKSDHCDFVHLLLQCLNNVKIVYFNNNDLSYKSSYFDNDDFVRINLNVKCDKSYNVYLSEIVIENENEKISSNFDSVDTIAKQATEEIVDVLYNDGTALNIPWVYEKYGINIINVNNTYDELTRYLNEPAYFRLGYNLVDNKLNIPVFFSLIDGVNEDIEKYWLDYDTFKSCSDLLYFENDCLIKEKNGVISKPVAFLTDGFRLSDIKKLSNYKYNMLRPKIENLLFDCLNELCFGNYFNFGFKDIEKYYLLLDVYLNIPSNFIDLLQNYDYGKSVPKVLIYKDGSTIFNDREIILLCFLNRLGFDILILNPSGYRLFKDSINENIINNLRLNKYVSDLTVPTISFNNPINNDKVSFFKRLFN